jgi:hypothetical protein
MNTSLKMDVNKGEKINATYACMSKKERVAKTVTGADLPAALPGPRQAFAADAFVALGDGAKCHGIGMERGIAIGAPRRLRTRRAPAERSGTGADDFVVERDL